MIELVLVLIYLVSFAIHLLMEYKENKSIHDVGGLIDSIRFYMWFPLLNTILLIAVGLCILILKLWHLLKLNILWEKFRNIKLK